MATSRSRQSIVETAWFNYPDYGLVRPTDNNFAGIGACSSCGTGFGFTSAPNGVRAQLQLLRNYADASSSVATIPDPPVPELWGSTPATANYNFDHYFAKGRAPLWIDMGNGNWATSPDYATVVLRVVQPDADLQRCAVSRVRRPPGGPTGGREPPSTTTSCSCPTSAPPSDGEAR